MWSTSSSAFIEFGRQKEIPKRHNKTENHYDEDWKSAACWLKEFRRLKNREDMYSINIINNYII